VLGAAPYHHSFSDFQALGPQIARRDPRWAFAGTYRELVGTIDAAASIRLQRQTLGRFFDVSLRRRRGPRPPRLTSGACLTGFGGAAARCVGN
jgi:hypothetical protein